MGTWSASILGNDLARDVRQDYRDLLEDGVDDQVATETIIARYKGSAENADEATSFWTGLAFTQMKIGRLQGNVRDNAIALINEGGDLHLWPAPRDAKKRRKALEQLRDQLLGPQRPPVRLRRPTPVTCPVEAGDIFQLLLTDGRMAILHTIAVDEHRMGRLPVVEMIDAWGRPFQRVGPFVRRNRAKSEGYARFHVVAQRQRDVAADDVLKVVGHKRPPKNTRAYSYLGWTSLRAECLRLLDDARAQPENGSKLFKRRPRLQAE